MIPATLVPWVEGWVGPIPKIHRSAIAEPARASCCRSNGPSRIQTVSDGDPLLFCRRCSARLEANIVALKTLWNGEHNHIARHQENFASEIFVTSGSGFAMKQGRRRKLACSDAVASARPRFHEPINPATRRDPVARSRSKRREAQITAALKQVEKGWTTDGVARECGASGQTIYAADASHSKPQVAAAEQGSQEAGPAASAKRRGTDRREFSKLGLCRLSNSEDPMQIRADGVWRGTPNVNCSPDRIFAKQSIPFTADGISATGGFPSGARSSELHCSDTSPLTCYI
jgi:hypothetical protein